MALVNPAFYLLLQIQLFLTPVIPFAKASLLTPLHIPLPVFIASLPLASQRLSPQPQYLHAEITITQKALFFPLLFFTIRKILFIINAPLDHFINCEVKVKVTSNSLQPHGLYTGSEFLRARTLQ